MAHPYYHSLSTRKGFGGTWEDYFPFHAFMDHTKQHIADARHRLLLHNAWGIFFVEQLFGETFIRPSDGKRKALRPILERHVEEDFGGKLPSLPECFEIDSKRPFSRLDDTIEHCRLSAMIYGGDPEEYMALHASMNQVRDVLPDQRGQCILHNSWGISLLLRKFGETMTLSTGKKIPTRMVLEFHVTQDLGHIPTVAEAMEHIHIRSWMYTKARKLSVELAGESESEELPTDIIVPAIPTHLEGVPA